MIVKDDGFLERKIMELYRKYWVEKRNPPKKKKIKIFNYFFSNYFIFVFYFRIY